MDNDETVAIYILTMPIRVVMLGGLGALIGHYYRGQAANGSFIGICCGVFGGCFGVVFLPLVLVLPDRRKAKAAESSKLQEEEADPEEDPIDASTTCKACGGLLDETVELGQPKLVCSQCGMTPAEAEQSLETRPSEAEEEDA